MLRSAAGIFQSAIAARHDCPSHPDHRCQNMLKPGQLKNMEAIKMQITILCYDKCSTCQKALKWLNERNIDYLVRPIKEQNPTEAELRLWCQQSGLPLKRFFNTSGQKYRQLNLKERLKDMTDDEQYALLASDGMLVKRPLLISEAFICPGFREDEWAHALC